MRETRKGKINYQTTYRKVLVRKIMRTVNIKGESTVNGSRCTMERTSPWPRTVTINKNTTSGNGIAPSQQSLHEYLLAAVPVFSFMIISLLIFPPYYVVFVFFRLLLFFVYTYWLYLSASIALSLPFFLVHTWNTLSLCRHP